MQKFFQFLLIYILTYSTMNAQENIMWESRKDPKSDEMLLVGPCALHQVDSLGTYAWLEEGVKKYKLDSNAVKALKNKMTGYKLVAFGGTWCEDTQLLMPNFYKIVKALALPSNQVDVHWVDRAKRGLYFETEFYDIQFVPTFIIMKGPREVGRIVESVSKESLEQELLYLINKDQSINK